MNEFRQLTEMTPLEITLILHVYARADQIPSVEYPAQQRALRKFHELGLVKLDLERPVAHRLCLTSLGHELVDRLTLTPLISPPNEPPGRLALEHRRRVVAEREAHECRQSWQGALNTLNPIIDRLRAELGEANARLAGVKKTSPRKRK